MTLKIGYIECFTWKICGFSYLSSKNSILINTIGGECWVGMGVYGDLHKWFFLFLLVKLFSLFLRYLYS